jgi:hypothetical protein
MIKQAFPDYPIADLPPIPSHWRDISWHNDACPSFEVSGLQVFVDYADPAKRETAHYGLADVRFHVMEVETARSIIASDDWQAVLDAVDDCVAEGIDAEAARSRA